MSKAVYVDLERCIACRACELACLRLHKGLSNISVEVIEDRYALPLLCRQCEKATCVDMCYAHALQHGEDDMVQLDAEKCTGCGLCTLACPFGVVYLKEKVAHKCDLCQDRDTPACVVTCPAEALMYGEYELASRVARRRAGQGMKRAMASPERGGVRYG